MNIFGQNKGSLTLSGSATFFATTGLRPDLRFWVSDAFVGGAITTHAPPVVRLEVRCNTPVARVEIMRDGQRVYEWVGYSRDLAMEWQNACRAGDHYYYAHVVFEGEATNPFRNVATAYGVDAWSSPVWVSHGSGS